MDAQDGWIDECLSGWMWGSEGRRVGGERCKGRTHSRPPAHPLNCPHARTRMNTCMLTRTHAFVGATMTGALGNYAKTLVADDLLQARRFFATLLCFALVCASVFCFSVALLYARVCAFMPSCVCALVL